MMKRRLMIKLSLSVANAYHCCCYGNKRSIKITKVFIFFENSIATAIDFNEIQDFFFQDLFKLKTYLIFSQQLISNTSIYNLNMNKSH